VSSAFLDLLTEKVALGDGAMGTLLYERGVPAGVCYEELNLTDADLITGIHREYRGVGADVLETNTYQANPTHLAPRGLAGKVRDINYAGAKLALRAAGSKCLVAGAVGPTTAADPSAGDPLSPDEIAAAFSEQITVLAEAGVHAILLETFPDLDEILLAIDAARRVCDLPIIAQLIYSAPGRTAYGQPAAECAEACIERGAAVVGANCGRGVIRTLDAVRALAALDDVLISAFPNAGMPEIQDGRTYYAANEQYVAERVAEMADLGACLVGGCCGTGPAYISAIREALDARPAPGAPRVAVAPERVTVPEAPPEIGKGGLLDGLAPDRFPVIVEIDPPRQLRIEHVLHGARAVREAGADAVAIGDNPLAALRVGNIATGALVRQRTGIQVIAHVTCRDRNVIGLQAGLMGAHLLGLEAVLAVTGDPAALSDQPRASGVFDLNSYRLVDLISRLNSGHNLAGAPLEARTNFSIGVAVNFNAGRPDAELRRLARKRDAGAHFAMSQPVFAPEHAQRMIHEARSVGLPVFVGVFPLVSSRNAEFLHNEVPGIRVPDDARRRLAALETPDEQAAEGQTIARELIEAIVPSVDGIYLISPLNRWPRVVELVQFVRELAQKESDARGS
jgi:homocysteine S-methyltransferase